MCTIFGSWGFHSEKRVCINTDSTSYQEEVLSLTEQKDDIVSTMEQNHKMLILHSLIH